MAFETCKHGHELTAENSYTTKQRNGSPYTSCRTCRQVAYKLHTQNNPGKRAEYTRAYRARRTPEEVEEDRHKGRARARKNRAKDPEKAKASHRRYYYAHHEEIRAKRNSGVSRAAHLKSAYKMTPDAYLAMQKAQDYCCAICGEEAVLGGANLHVDHDHGCCPGTKTCGQCIRGLLCDYCNKGIGALRDSYEIASKASSYLKQYEEA